MTRTSPSPSGVTRPACSSSDSGAPDTAQVRAKAWSSTAAAGPPSLTAVSRQGRIAVAVAGPLAADAEPADHRAGAVGDDQLAVVAGEVGDDVERAESVEGADLDARAAQEPPELAGGEDRAHRVVEHPHREPLPRPCRQRLGEAPAPRCRSG